MQRCLVALLVYLDTVQLSSAQNPAQHPNREPAESPGHVPSAKSEPVVGDQVGLHWLATPFHEVTGHGQTESQTHRCEPVTLSLCKGMYYQFTRMPNMFYHETQEEAGLEAHQFYPLVQINCSEDLRFLLCSMYTPICVKAYPHFLPPCRSICERVKAGCTPIMQMYDFPWPERMSCDQFPEYLNPEGVLCMERNLNDSYPLSESGSAEEYPLTQSLEHTTLSIGLGNSNLANRLKGLVGPQQKNNTSIQHSKKFDAMASELLRQVDLENATLKKWLASRPDVALTCSCSCRTPLVRLTEGRTTGLPEILRSPAMQHCGMPCQPPYFTDYPSAGFTNFWFASWAVLCCLSALITVLTYLTDRTRFHYPELPIIFLAGCYFMIAVAYLLRVSLGHEAIACELQSATTKARGADPETQVDHPRPRQFEPVVSGVPVLHQAVPGRASCTAVFLLSYFFGTASSVWWLVLMITWFLAAAMKWGTEAISKYSQLYHFISWSAPTVLTALAFILSAVEVDPSSGMCTIGVNNRLLAIGFLLAPSLICLLTGCFFLSSGFIALFRIRDVLKMQPAGRGKTEKLEKLMIRIGIFGLLYIIPNSVVLATLSYELHGANTWSLGLACDCKYARNGIAVGEDLEDLPKWKAAKPEYAMFLIKHFMNLAVGIVSGFWVWSQKTLRRWKNVLTQGISLDKPISKRSGLSLTLHHNPVLLEHELPGRGQIGGSGLNSQYHPSKRGEIVSGLTNQNPSHLLQMVGTSMLVGCPGQQECTRSTVCSNSVPPFDGLPMGASKSPYPGESGIVEADNILRMPGQHAQWSRQSSSGIGSCLSPLSSENKVTWGSGRVQCQTGVMATGLEPGRLERHAGCSTETDKTFLLSSADHLDAVGLPTPTNSDRGSSHGGLHQTKNIWDSGSKETQPRYEAGSVAQLAKSHVTSASEVNQGYFINNTNIATQGVSAGTPIVQISRFKH